MGEKYAIWHVQGGLGKNVAATALVNDFKNRYPERKLILVCSFPELFLNYKAIDRVYSIGNHPYFYENYIENKDVIIFKHEPYEQTGHITKKNHVIKSWCELLDIKYQNQQPNLLINISQNQYLKKWDRPKPILLLQTNGGPLQDLNNPIPPVAYEWTRDIPIELAQSIVDKYSLKYHIIHLTKPEGYILSGVERLDTKVPLMNLISLVSTSHHRILIDSSLQHLSAAMNLPSIVFWIGTSPTVFGYNLHKNITAKLPIKANQLINSYTFDYQFADNSHECPYLNVNEMYNIKETLNSLDTLL